MSSHCELEPKQMNMLCSFRANVFLSFAICAICLPKNLKNRIITPKATGTPFLTADIVRQLYDRLRTTNNSYTVKVDKRFDMQCRNQLVNDILERYPEATTIWIKNGKPLELVKSRMEYKAGTLVIFKLQEEDTGVYVCQIQYNEEKHMTETVELYALTVDSPKIHIQTSAGFEEVLTCHSKYIGLLFNEAHQKWYCNGALMRDYRKVVNRDSFVFVDESMSGIWTCEVTVNDTLKWVTNRLRTRVTRGLDIWRRLEEYKTALIIICLLINTLVIVCLVSLWLKRKREIQGKASHQVLPLDERFLKEVRLAQARAKQQMHMK